MSHWRSTLIGSTLVAAFGLLGATPLIDAESHRPPADATLVIPTSYSFLAPVHNILDALTILSLRQHLALFLTLVVVVGGWRTVVHRQERTPWTRELWIGALAFAIWLAVYAVGALVPRPMAALKLRNPDDLAVDFHSHTGASWDGRRWFTPERNRAWHTGAGFDIAYVSDHRSFAGAISGSGNNPSRADGRTILLPALEARDQYQHVIAIGIDPRAPIDTQGNWHDPHGDTTLANRWHRPMLILTIPGNVRTLPENEEHGVARVMAVELSDAAPRGLNQIQRDEHGILALADRLQLAVVAGSDNHGWGSTAAAWSVMRIPGWRALTPAQLDSAIRRTIYDRRRSAVRVYLRDTPNPGGSWAALVLTLPAVVWHMLVDLSWPERCAWIAWMFVVGLLSTAYYSVWRRRSTVMAMSTDIIRLPVTAVPGGDTATTTRDTPMA